jgi:hypothetical protein
MANSVPKKATGKSVAVPVIAGITISALAAGIALFLAKKEGKGKPAPAAKRSAAGSRSSSRRSSRCASVHRRSASLRHPPKTTYFAVQRPCWLVLFECRRAANADYGRILC